ncbi:MAG: sigma-70 family RNA polymerase sigma factor [Calditrichae bacterium]|nr:sigma-70 family RNA polymerase sigma factor [Calditrichia bacterium]NIV72695.1 sigma-70 family RNA polymerase sigma factor [Calditrichia bacterium]
MENNEIALIKRAQKGDVNAFDDLVRLHDRKIFQLIHSMVGNFNDTYDIHQETFIRAYTNIATFRFESNFSTWLGRIAINFTITWRKRQRLKFWISLEDTSNFTLQWKQSDEANHQNSAENKLLNKELMHQVERHLNRLPEQQRAVFILKHIHNYRIKEIAEMMKCAEGTVKNHLFRATQKLRKVLLPYYKGLAEL